MNKEKENLWIVENLILALFLPLMVLIYGTTISFIINGATDGVIRSFLSIFIFGLLLFFLYFYLLPKVEKEFEKSIENKD